MRPPASIDELYLAFVTTLPSDLVRAGEALACTLGLAPSPDVRWSEVFGHEVTLAAPLLFAEAMPRVDAGVVEAAVLAHALAVIEAFGTDRIEDGQVEATPALLALLERLRVARDDALARIDAGAAAGEANGRRADDETRRAICEEREILTSGRAVTMDEYEAVSLGKQAVGFPASAALACAAGWSDARRRAVRRALAGVWLGLQVHDDVVDWRDDLARGGAWAAAVARGRGAVVDPADPAPGVMRSGALAAMLSRARRLFRGARRRARALGAARLAAWAAEREAKLAELAANEAASSGYTERARALWAWASEVLA